jgi:hypothetical protein
MDTTGYSTGDLDKLRRKFKFFAQMCAEHSPLYAFLSSRAVEDDAVLALATERQPGQSAVNLLFAAVQYLLLGGAEHSLASFYPSVGGDRSPEKAYPPFADFCRVYATEIRRLVASRRVQTNEVGRCGLLLPAFALASTRFGGRPLELVEVGSSAGLALQFDRYEYAYTDKAGKPLHTCGPASSARVRTELREGDACPLPDRLPEVTGRTGIDVTPLDVADDDAVRWIASLIWADQRHRHELFHAAVQIARPKPAPCIAGDGVEVLPRVVAAIAPNHLPCIFHSHTIYQMPEAWRHRFADVVATLGRERDLVHLSLEWLGDEPRPQLRAAFHAEGVVERVHLADCHTHGFWMRWIAT